MGVCVCNDWFYGFDGDYCTGASWQCFHADVLYEPGGYYALPGVEDVYYCAGYPENSWVDPCVDGYRWDLLQKECVPEQTPVPEFASLLVPALILLLAPGVAYLLLRRRAG